MCKLCAQFTWKLLKKVAVTADLANVLIVLIWLSFILMSCWLVFILRCEGRVLYVPVLVT